MSSPTIQRELARAPEMAAGSGARSVLRALAPTLFIVACIALWQAAVVILNVKPYLLPAPTAIAARLVQSWSVLAHNTIVTLEETLAGFVLGGLIGFGLAVAIAYSRLLERMLYPLIVASQAVPKIAIAPLFVVWFGFGIWPKIVVTILLTFFPVVVTTGQGLMSVDQTLIDLLRSVSAPTWQVFVKIRLPHALPQIVSGLKIGITLAVV
ncbi:MAG: ABC transporter permease, partial [Chloroflexota bacterium]